MMYKEHDYPDNTHLFFKNRVVLQHLTDYAIANHLFYEDPLKDVEGTITYNTNLLGNSQYKRDGFTFLAESQDS